jgi:hypothetical protein
MGNADEQKPIHLVHCPECKGYHKSNIKVTTYGIGPLPPDLLPDEFQSKLFSGPIECRATGKTFIPTEDDWLHLTEDEFHRRFPDYRRSN